MPSGQIALLNPVAKVTVQDRPIAKVLNTMNGKVVGIWETYNYWRGFGLFINKLKELLPERYGVSGFLWHKPSAASGVGFSDPNLAQIEQESFSEFAKQVDCVITGGAF